MKMTLSYTEHSSTTHSKVNLLDNDQCGRDYAETNESITASMICASGRSGSGITDTCQGSWLNFRSVERYLKGSTSKQTLTST